MIKLLKTLIYVTNKRSTLIDSVSNAIKKALINNNGPTFVCGARELVEVRTKGAKLRVVVCELRGKLGAKARSGF
jgi:hypothetical protein